MAQYDGSIRINTQILVEEAKKKLSSFATNVSDASKKISSKMDLLRSKMNFGKAIKMPTESLKELENEYSILESKIQKLAEKQHRFLEIGGKEDSQAYKGMEYDLDRLTEKQDEVLSKIKLLKSQSNLSKEFGNISALIKSAFKDAPIIAFKAAVNGVTKVFKKMGSVSVSALKKTGNMALSIAKGPFKILASMAKGAFSRITKSTSGANKSFGLSLKNILKYGFGIRSLYALFNKLRSAIKEGYQNLYNDNERFKNSVDGLKASATTLKNSLAAAFRPLVDIAIPYIQKVMDYMSGLLDSVGQFLAAITGQRTYTKAIKQTTAALKEEKKAAEGYLSPLDEINKYQTNKDSGADAGTGGTMFQEIPISNKFKDLAQWFKDMWASADFTELGTLLGEKIKSALDNIPWDQIKETARKIGSSIATFINGFVEVKDLGYSIGRTLSEAVNTGFEFLNEFVHKLHWDSIGHFIADSLNGIFQNIDWQLIYDTFVTGAKGLGDAINSFVDDLDWSSIANSISNFVNTFFDTIYTFFATVDWMKLGQEIGRLITDSVKGIDWSGMGSSISTMLSGLLDLIIGVVSEIDWSEIWKAIIDFLTNINYLELIGKLIIIAYYLIEGIVEGLIKAITETDWGAVWDRIVQAFKDFFGIHSPSTLMSEMGTYIMQGLLNGIGGMVGDVKEKWNLMKQQAVEAWGNIKQKISEKVNDIKQNVSSKMDSIKSAWSSAWDGMKSKVGSIMESVKNTVKSAFDWIARKVEDIKDKLESVNRKSAITGTAASRFLSVSSSVSNRRSRSVISPEVLNSTPIPALARGAVIPANKEFLAVLGDQKHGTNIEAPLETIKQASMEAVAEVLSKLGLSGGNINGTPVNLTLQVALDGQVLGQKMVDWGKLQQMATGGNPYAF